MKFHDFHGISWFLRFPWFCGFMTCLKPLIFLREYWCFGGVARRHAENHTFPGFLWKIQEILGILHFSHKNMGSHGFSAFWGARTLQKHQNSLRNINGFHHGGGRAPILWKCVIFTGIHGNSQNSLNSWGNGGFLIKYRYSRPHGWNHWYS